MINKINSFLFWAACTAFSACAPRVQSTLLHQRPALPSHENVVLLEKGAAFNPAGLEKVSTIAIGEGGFTLNCEYFFIAALAKEQARKAGGNLVHVTEHKKPDAWSSCHRLRADVYYSPDISDYESEIGWRQERKLQAKDFKGPTDNHPFTAVTFSGIKVEAATLAGLPPRLQVSIESVFDCRKSYIADTSGLQFTLEHEQLHFDITEWHARKLRQRVQEKAISLGEWNNRMEHLFQEANEELYRMQDQYDSEVYTNPDRQEAWKLKVQAELYALEAFKHPSFVLSR